MILVKKDNVLSYDLHISKYPITQKEYRDIMKINPSDYKGKNRPVESVSLYDAILYCNKRSKKEMLKPAYKIKSISYDKNGSIREMDVKYKRDSNGYRLPRGYEWMHVYNGGSNSKKYKYSGSDNLEEVAWYSENSRFTKDVGLKKPNELGIYDMSGNVYEWCWDYYGDRKRIALGQSYIDAKDIFADPSSGKHCELWQGENYIGFRVARGVISKKRQSYKMVENIKDSTINFSEKGKEEKEKEEIYDDKYIIRDVQKINKSI